MESGPCILQTVKPPGSSINFSAKNSRLRVQYLSSTCENFLIVKQICLNIWKNCAFLCTGVKLSRDEVHESCTNFISGDIPNLIFGLLNMLI